jgi:biotin transport system substrate-specific component
MPTNTDMKGIYRLSPVYRTVLIALGAASIAVGAFIAIPLPLSPVPIVLQNFFILLIALVLGPRMGTASVALYLLLGALGLPVFAGGKGGLAHFFGPTGGYLAGFLLSAWVTGVLAAGSSRQKDQEPHAATEGLSEGRQDKGQYQGQEPRAATKGNAQKTKFRFQDAAAAAAGVLAVYLLGVPWLAYKLGFDWKKALTIGFLPFIIGDVLKAAAAAALAPEVRRLLLKEFYPDAG